MLVLKGTLLVNCIYYIAVPNKHSFTTPVPRITEFYRATIITSFETAISASSFLKVPEVGLLFLHFLLYSVSLSAKT